MRTCTLALLVLPIAILPGEESVLAQGQPSLARVLTAKTAYLDNQTGSSAVGDRALACLRGWGKFQIVADPSSADLLLVLSADPNKGGNIIFSGGQTGSVDRNGNIEEDSVPTFHKQSPTRHAYLTVIDRNSGKSLWTGDHVWGGLLTGFNSVGEKLILELREQLSKARSSGLTVVNIASPVYPEDAAKRHIARKVVVEIVVDQNGTVRDAKAVSGPPELVQSALDSARQCQFEPPARVPTVAKLEVAYFAYGPCAEPRKPEFGEVLIDKKLPMAVYQPLPAYPKELVEAGITGKLVITISVDRTGEVIGAAVTKPLHPVLDALSLEKAKSWKFKGSRGGPAAFQVTLSFQLTCRDSVETRID